jgi:hypothetical protein
MIRSKKHLKFIASLPCLTTGLEGSTQAAHIRSGLYAMGMKPDDSLTVPLSWMQHALQHNGAEKDYWKDKGGIENIKALAIQLYENTGDEYTCRDLINDYRERHIRRERLASY